MSGIARRKEGRFGAGYVGYFSRPQQAARTLLHVARRHRPRASRRASCNAAGASSRACPAAGSTPCCGRSRPSSAATCPCRACSTTWPRAGPPSTSTCSATTRSPTTPGPSGPTPSPCCATSTARSHRIARSFQWAPRPYHLVVLSDHGQTQGPPFQDLAGETLAELVGRLCGAAVSGDPDAERGARSRPPGCATPGPPTQRERRPGRGRATCPTVLGSGSLGLDHVARPAPPAAGATRSTRATRPLLDGLAGHPHIGFVLVASAEGSLVLGPSGQRNLATRRGRRRRPAGAVRRPGRRPGAPRRRLRDGRRRDGQRPLRPRARRGRRVRVPGRLARRPRRPPDPPVPALPDRLSPTRRRRSSRRSAMHRVLKSWLAEVGQPVVRPWLADGPDPTTAPAVNAPPES